MDDLFATFTSRSPWSHSRRLEKVLPLLEHSDPEKRREAVDALDGFSLMDFVREFTVPKTLGIKMLKTAVRVPAVEDFEEELPSKLLRFLWKGGRPEYLPVLEEIYDSLEARKEGRECALRILTEMQTRESLALLTKLLERPSSRAMELDMVFVPLKPSRLLAESFLPGLLKVIPKVNSRGTLYNLVLSFANEGHAVLSGDPLFADQCRGRISELMGSHGCSFDTHVRWLDRLDKPPRNPEAEALSAHFHEVEVLVDLLAHLPSPRSVELLQQLLARTSFRLKCFAVGSLLRQGARVEDSLLKDLAHHPRSRGLLWTVLEERGALERFPWEDRTQERLAEAKLCEWLEFPTELGCAPHEIRKIAVVRVPHEGRSVLCYFFKFRCEGGWEVGMAGPYPDGGPPTLKARETFSKFTPLEKLTLEEHVRDFVGEETLFTIVERGEDAGPRAHS